MENKKLVAGAASLAVLANMALAGAAFAESATGSASVTAGTLSVSLTDGYGQLSSGTLTFGDATNSCSGSLSVSVEDAGVCALIQAKVADLESSADDVQLDMKFSGDFTDSDVNTDDIPTSGGGASVDTDNDDDNGTLSGAELSDFEGSAITEGDHGVFTDDTNSTVLAFDKASATAEVSFVYTEDFLIDVVIPAFTDESTYTNTITFTVSNPGEL